MSFALHLVLITRSDPPFELSRMRLVGKLLEIRMESLRFSDSDAATYLNKMMKSQLAERDVKQLNNRTEGWIAGLQLAPISLRNQTDQIELKRSKMREKAPYWLSDGLKQMRLSCVCSMKLMH